MNPRLLQSPGGNSGLTGIPLPFNVSLMKRPSPLRILCLPALLAFLSGCTIPDNTAEMWTNIPEMAAYADQFNAGQSEFRVKVVYKENPGQALRTDPVIPDLVIGTGLNSIRYSTVFSDLSPLFDEKRGSLREETFYPDLLNLGRRGDQLLALPLSFNLPVLYYRNDSAAAAGEASALPDQSVIRERSRAFALQSAPDFPVRGFSPLWNGAYIYSIAQLEGTGFHESESGQPQWDDKLLESTLQDAAGWAEPSTGGMAEELNFMEKYLYQPAYKLVNRGRILYSYTNTWDFYQIPATERRNLRILWVSDGSRVPAGDSILFGAIPRKGEDKKAAGEFLSWFLQARTQKSLLESAQFRRIRSFGIARGFSSLILVNELDFPVYYPTLLGIFPNQRQILFPSVLPAEWDRVRSEVVTGWLTGRLKDPRGTVPLTEAVRNWYNQNSRN